jgi:hypothetical protein
MITIYGCSTRRGDEDCSHGFELSASLALAPNQTDWHSNYAIVLSRSSRTWALFAQGPAEKHSGRPLDCCHQVVTRPAKQCEMRGHLLTP